MSSIEEKLIEKTFKHEFNETNFSEFVKELFNDSKIIEINPEKRNVWREYGEYIEYFKDHGTYTDPDNNKIKILSVNLKKSSSRDRARVMQRNFIAKFLENYSLTESYDAAIVAFYGEEQKDWRLSFVKLEYKINDKLKIEKGLTPAKRYSYLVGPNEPNYTCRKQFFGVIGPKIELHLKDLEDIFSVEKVTDEFFEEYKNLFLRLKEEIDNLLESDPKIKNDFEAKNISSVEFAKKLLGQIVFIYFLQKKGWLGIKRESNGDFALWGAGPRDFLKKLYNKEYIEYDNFFKDVLEPLFYEALSSKRDNDYFSLLKCKIPFLNGGLFEAIEGYDWNQINLNLSNGLFKDIIAKFDMYNFTVKEDEPLDKEVAVDPEMLGKVFENLLDVFDRKSKGAFYTPREIVHYMCQQSLINYLETHTDISKTELENYILMDGFSSADDIRNFLELERVTKRLKESKFGTSEYTKYLNEQVNVIQKFNVSKEIRNNSKIIDDLLKNVKIADPAVGSGAFPVGMMNEIVKARSILTPFLVARGTSSSDERAFYNLKRDTIENSLYCVDIDSSATDITKLRFWLSLVVDEENIENIRALPNLDHKIMCGNSLIDEFEGIKLFDESLIEKKLDQFENDQKYKELKQKLNEISEEYDEKSSVAQEYTKNQNWKELDGIRIKLGELGQLKKSLEKKIDKIKEKYNLETFEKITLDEPEKLKKSRLKLRELRKLYKAYFDENGEEKKEIWKKIEDLEWGLIEAKFKESGNPEKLDKLKKMVKSKSKPFFIWKLYFYEVFNRKEAGFDIVIGNPPYVGEGKNKDIFVPVQESSFGKRYYTGKMDFWYFFTSLGLELLNCNGILSYIAPNNWLTTYGGKKMRNHIMTSAKITEFINFGDYKVFENADQQTMIFFLENEQDTDEFTVQYSEVLDKNIDKHSLNNFLDKRPSEKFKYFSSKLIRSSYVPYDNIQFLDTTIDNVIQKISDGSNINLLPNEITNGIHPHHAVVTKKMLNVLNNGACIGDGIFVLSDREISNLGLTKDEKKLLRPLYCSEHTAKFHINKNNPKFIIYTGSEFKNANLMNKYPNLKKHLDNYKEVISSDNRPYGLHRARNELFFNDDKILSIRKCRIPTFSYASGPTYVLAEYYVIKTDRIDMRYLTGLLNSKLIAFWLRNMGKMQGSNYQVDKEPLLNIPIKIVSDDLEKTIGELVDKIINLKEQDNHTLKSEDELDKIIYDIYGLNETEIKIIEESFKN